MVEFSNLCGLANFRTDYLPLVRFVLLDSVEKGLTLLEHQQLCSFAIDHAHTSSSANSA